MPLPRSRQTSSGDSISAGGVGGGVAGWPSHAVTPSEPRLALQLQLGATNMGGRQDHNLPGGRRVDSRFESDPAQTWAAEGFDCAESQSARVGREFESPAVH